MVAPMITKRVGLAPLSASISTRHRANVYALATWLLIVVDIYN